MGASQFSFIAAVDLRWLTDGWVLIQYGSWVTVPKWWTMEAKEKGSSSSVMLGSVGNYIVDRELDLVRLEW